MRAVVTRVVPFVLLSFASGCSNGESDPVGNGVDEPRTCTQASDCEPGEQCVGGWCEPATATGCLRDSDCPDGFECDALTASCVESENAGPDPICEPGETRCRDSLTQETCNEDGSDWTVETCEHECFNDACVICSPGSAECVEEVSRVCNEDGTGWVEQDCGELGVDCVDGHCLVCSPGERRCVDENVFEICNDTGSGWDDYACLEGHCDEETGTCIQDGCTPGRYTCDGTVRMVCDDDGETWNVVEDCGDVSGGDCVGGRCIDLCSEAVANNSYIGCEYWPVVLSNTQLDSDFFGDFAVVVGNPSTESSAEVEVFSHSSANPIQTRAVAPGELEIMYLPWNAMDAVVGGSPTTQKGLIAYRVESSIPVTAYQFNPLRSRIGNEYSHTNDASLLLPTHVFGVPSRYLALTLPHARLGSFDQPSLVAIVGTEDGTEVTIRMRGYTAAGGGLPELSPGHETTVTLDRHEVLQLSSRTGGSDVDQVSSGGDTYSQYNDADLSGTIIDADKPVAVFGGADCRFVPFDEWACDHLEQQLYPFQNWGSSHVGAVTLMPRGGEEDAGNVFRILAGVDGTQLTFTPSYVHSQVTLQAGEVLELQTDRHFFVESQGPGNPILMGQWLLGQNAFGECGLFLPGPCADVGDPSMILNVPTQQFRASYHFTTVDTISDNHINVIRYGSVQVSFNGSPLTGCWVPIQGTSYQVCRKEVPGGNHRITSVQPVGVVVYGYDEYVSYGYPAGLELQLMGVPDPGW